MSIYIDFENPANAGILRYLAFTRKSLIPNQALRNGIALSPEQVVDPYMRLGTHPELVERIWDVLPKKLPEDCRCVVYQTPVLANFHTGVVFAFAGGTHTYAFRLPPRALAEAIQSGAKRAQQYPAYPNLGIKASGFSLDELGNEWVFGGWLKGEEEWCLAAYSFAGEVGK